MAFKLFAASQFFQLFASILHLLQLVLVGFESFDEAFCLIGFGDSSLIIDSFNALVGAKSCLVKTNAQGDADED